jgi:hypothetical protein
MNYKTKIKSIIALSLIFSLSSCYLLFDPMPKGWDWGFKSRPLTGVRNFPPANTEYGKGFKDGCVSAWDAVSKGLTGDLAPKFSYKRMQKSPDYGTGWWDGFEQCTYIIDHDVV